MNPEDLSKVPSADVLEQAHNFPCRYTIKIIGDSTPAFTHAIRQVMQGQGRNTRPYESIERASQSGRHSAYTLRWVANSAQEVQEVYLDLQHIAGVRFLI